MNSDLVHTLQYCTVYCTVYMYSHLFIKGYHLPSLSKKSSENVAADIKIVIRKLPETAHAQGWRDF